jgi:hypothetical protein
MAFTAWYLSESNLRCWVRGTRHSPKSQVAVPHLIVRRQSRIQYGPRQKLESRRSGA